jgi:hypothetical protein
MPVNKMKQLLLLINNNFSTMAGIHYRRYQDEIDQAVKDGEHTKVLNTRGQVTLKRYFIQKQGVQQ